MNLIGSQTTLISFNPGVVETKMLKQIFGAKGIPLDEATDTFNLATLDTFINPRNFPKYFVDLKETMSAPITLDKAQCIKLYK